MNALALVAALACGIRVPAPTLSPVDGTTSTLPITVTVTSHGTGDTVYCARDTNPARVPTQRVTLAVDGTGSWQITETQTVNCRAYALDGRQPSRLATASYTIQPEEPPPVASADCTADPWSGTTYPVPTQNDTYYYCPTGSNTNTPADCGGLGTGRCPQSPRGSSFPTGWRAQFNALSSGQAVALCRGGTFTADSSNFTANCSFTNPCTLMDYTPSGVTPTQANRPILTGGKFIWGEGNNGAGPYGGWRFVNLIGSGNTGNGLSAMLSSGNVSHVDICNVRVSGSPGGIYHAGADQPIPQTFWALRHSWLEAIDGNGVLGGCTDCIIDSNYFANTSYAINNWGTHNIYLSNNADRMRITNNELHGCAPGTTVGTTQIVKPKIDHDMMIENNLIQCDNPSAALSGQGGIGIGHGDYPVSEGPTLHSRLIIRRNRFVGQVGFDLGLSQCQDCIVEDNTSIKPADSTGGSMEIGQNAGRDGNDAISTRNTIRNNSIFFAGSLNSQGPRPGIAVLREGTGHIITNNAIYFTENTGGVASCFSLPLAQSSYAMIANNACNVPAGTTYTTPITLYSSPFADAANGDFTPTSALIGQGTTATTCTVGGTQNRQCFSPTAIGTITWDPTDVGHTRVTTDGVDIGAMGD